MPQIGGAQILKGVVDSLWEGVHGQEYALNKATDVLLSGCSAGGLATFLNADTMGDEYFNTEKIPSLKRYKAMPISGFFLNQKTVLNENYYPGYMKVIHDLSK